MGQFIIPSNHVVTTADAAYDAVQQAFRASFPELARDLSSIELAWPNLPPILRRAAFFLSPAFPLPNDQSANAVVRALRNGCVASSGATAVNGYTPFLTTFITTLSEAVAGAAVFGIRRDGSDDGEPWALHDAPLSMWAANFDEISFLPITSNDVEFQATAILLSGRILGPGDLVALLGAERLANRQVGIFSELS